MSSSPDVDMSVDNLENESSITVISPNFVNARACGGGCIALLPPPDQSFHEDGASKVGTADYHQEFQVFQAKMLEILDKLCDKQDSKISQAVSRLDVKVKSLETQALHTKTLERKIESLEQQARQSNLEIGNIPDRRSENLITLLENLGTIFKHNISPNDIAAVHRVPHANSMSSHPKNIIVKFQSRIKRHNVLAAFRLAKGVTTDQLGVSGDPRKVYVNEHLTLANKKLFREARDAARKHGYRYVWVNHGTMLVRVNDIAPVIAIRSADDISKIASKPA